MSTVTLDLLVATDSAENDFCELATLEWSVCDPTDNF
ncbi:hypothetical protein PC116_g31788 [Phytophthora cactorum]|nr:hypothetical protein PC116_g31788 [Phytophthora cactorum]